MKGAIMPKAYWRGFVIAEAAKKDVETVEGNIYFPIEAVHKKYLQPSDTHTVCPWKGTASYFNVVVDVLYFRAELKYVTLRTKAREFVLEESLLSIEEEMGAQFVRVHRNTLVARNAITGVERGAVEHESDGSSDKSQESWQVILRDLDERLPISRRQWPIVKALLNKRG